MRRDGARPPARLTARKGGMGITPHELREKTVALCRQDPVFFTKNFVHIEDKDAAELVQPFRLWPMQEQALRQLHAHRDVYKRQRWEAVADELGATGDAWRKRVERWLAAWEQKNRN